MWVNNDREENDSNEVNNGKGVVYGFVTTGQDWQMLMYDGNDFVMSHQFPTLFDGFQEEKETWMKGYSVLIECIYISLKNGGMRTKDVVAGK